MRVKRDFRPEWAPSPDIRWGESGGTYRGESYYGLPAVRPSYYGLKAAGSYFAEGTGGASQILAAVTDLAGREEDRPLVRAGRYLALAGSLTAASLFIADLHTPSRWYNMLRIFRSTSLMSIGSWSLTSFGLFSGLTAAGQLLEDLGFKVGRGMARVFQIPAAAAGAMVSLYTGTELEETSLPLWARSSPLLAPLFFSVNTLNAVSALKLATRNGALSPGATARLDQLTNIARAVELVFLRRAIGRWKKPGPEHVPRRAFSGFSPRLRAQFLGVLASLPLRAVKRLNKEPRSYDIALPIVGLAAGLLLPAQIILAGNQSGKRPQEYLAYTQPASLPKSGRIDLGKGWNGKRGGSFTRYAAWGLGLFFAGTTAFWLRTLRKGGDANERNRAPAG